MPTQLSIAYTEPFSFKRCYNALYRSDDEILYHLEDDAIYRLIKLGTDFIPVMISEGENCILASTDIDLSTEQQTALEAYITHWFDLKTDLTPFYALLQKDTRLAHLPEKLHGLRIVGIPDMFEAICWSVVGQQINLSFAHKLKRRLVEHYGVKTTWRGKALHHFPTPEALLQLDEVYFHEQKQFSRSKLKYLKNVSEAFASGIVSQDRLAALPTFEERQAVLTSIKGIGVWSANYTLMKSLNQAEAIPFGDTGITQAMFNLGIINDRKDETAIKAFFESVKGWEAYTVFYLWGSLGLR